MVEKNNQDCQLKNTELCDFLGCDGCERCMFANGLQKSQSAEELANRWRCTSELLPPEIDELHETETCAFCGKEARTCYGELTLGHIEPEYKRGMILGFGKKVRMPIGSLIDVPISCCNSCKRKTRIADLLPIGCALVLLAIAIGILCIPPLGNTLSEVFFLLPLLILAAVFVAGYLIGMQLQKNMLGKAEQKMHLNPLSLPIVKKMTAAGWFPVPEVKNGYPRVHFVKHKIRENFRYFPKG